MKVHVLLPSIEEMGGKDTNPSLELMKESAKKMGVDLKIIHSNECSLTIDKKIRILRNGKPIRDIKVLLIRFGLTKNPIFHSNLIRQFELKGVKVINSLKSIEIAHDKWRAIQMFIKHGIPTPESFLLGSTDQVDLVIQKLGKPPYILKTLYGTIGKGVYIIESKRSLNSVANMLVGDGSNIPVLVQKFVPEAKGRDVRALVVGQKIVAAIERKAGKRGEFRSNFHLGGSVKELELTKKEKRMALKAAEITGLEVTGVDILRTNNGPQIIEVNSSPGFEGVTKATNKDIAGAVLKYAIEQSKKKK